MILCNVLYKEMETRETLYCTISFSASFFSQTLIIQNTETCMDCFIVFYFFYFNSRQNTFKGSQQYQM